MSIVNHTHSFQPAKGRSSNKSSAAKMVRSNDQKLANFKRAYMVLLTFALLAVVFAGIIALRALVWLHAFHH